MLQCKGCNTIRLQTSFPGVRLQAKGCGLRRRTCPCITKAVGWDPEGILAPPRGGHIQRRQLQRQMAENKELAQQVEAEQRKAQEELQKRRDARTQPQTDAQLVEYFMQTEGGEMNYEVARCRPLLTDDFFQYLKAEIGRERFSSSPREDRISELELLLDFLEKAVQAVDGQTTKMAAPRDRLMMLMKATDKKATLLEMAGNNELDQPLLDLLQQNINSARSQGADDAANFMEKLRDAARKFVIKV